MIADEITFVIRTPLETHLSQAQDAVKSLKPAAVMGHLLPMTSPLGQRNRFVFQLFTSHSNTMWRNFSWSFLERFCCARCSKTPCRQMTSKSFGKFVTTLCAASVGVFLVLVSWSSIWYSYSLSDSYCIAMLSTPCDLPGSVMTLAIFTDRSVVFAKL